MDQRKQHTPRRPRRIYVNVGSQFDSTGYMQPTCLTWKNRTYKIDRVQDYRPANSEISVRSHTDCYVVEIEGQEKHLFFERSDPLFSSHVGRWYVESSL